MSGTESGEGPRSHVPRDTRTDSDEPQSGRNKEPYDIQASGQARERDGDDRHRKMGESRASLDWEGPKTVHYDREGRRIGESRESRDFWGDSVIKHYQDGKKVGESRYGKEWEAAETVHFDLEGGRIGESRESHDFWGDPVIKHYQDGGVVGESRRRRDLSGPNTKHYGTFNPPSIDTGYAERIDTGYTERDAFDIGNAIFGTKKARSEKLPLSMKLVICCFIVFAIHQFFFPESSPPAKSDVESPGAVKTLNEGSDLINAGEFSQAALHLTNIIRRNPQDAAAYSNRASAYVHLGNYQQALNDYNSALRLNSQDPNFTYGRGVVYQRIGQRREALVDYQTTIRLRPDFADAHYGLGSTYEQLGDNVRAIEHYTRAISLKPHEVSAYMGRGIVYGKLGQIDHAIADFTQGLHLRPNESSIYRFRSNAYASLGRFDLALADIDRAIRLNPNDGTAHSARQAILQQLGHNPVPNSQAAEAIAPPPVNGEWLASKTAESSSLPQPDQSAVQPSFNCANARTPSEKLICRDSELAASERQMAAAYNQVLSGLFGPDKDAFRRAHYNWFKEYARVCNASATETALRECVTHYLSSRTTQLRQVSMPEQARLDARLVNSTVGKVISCSDPSMQRHGEIWNRKVTQLPKLLRKVEPNYSEEGRQARIQGTVQLIVNVDENGSPRDICVQRALGYGLDEKAIEAVQQWRFHPAQLNGEPLAFSAPVEVNFRLL